MIYMFFIILVFLFGFLPISQFIIVCFPLFFSFLLSCVPPLFFSLKIGLSVAKTCKDNNTNKNAIKQGFCCFFLVVLSLVIAQRTKQQTLLFFHFEAKQGIKKNINKERTTNGRKKEEKTKIE